ncbi:MAG: carboxyl transferase domain-containing protein, partial [Actinomycetes bacterium]
MPILRSVMNPSDPTFQDNEAVQHQHLEALSGELAKALDGGGETYRKRHKARGKLLARERIALLLDEGAPFLEFSSLVGYGSEFAVGGAIVTGLGVVSGTECVIAANDPTVRGGAINPYGLK